MALFKPWSSPSLPLLSTHPHTHTDHPPKTSAVKRLNFDSPGEEDIDAGSVSPKSLNHVPSPHHTPGVSQSSILAIPKADVLWYEAKDSPDEANKGRTETGAKVNTRRTNYGGQGGSRRDSAGAVVRKSALKQSGSLKQGRMKVRFTAEAVVLNAALEGELELLQQCVHEVRGGERVCMV